MSTNNEKMKCPQCQVEATQVGLFWICPTHGQLSDPKPHIPLRIFLSYGHDENEELVQCIKADLEMRGHEVWFDKSEIKFGDDWRRSIVDGIKDSHLILSFLSKYSTRNSSVCRDEIIIAIGAKGGNIQAILIESEQEITVPPGIGPLEWLDMHDWKKRRAAGESAWKAWYQAKLAEIVRVVESDKSRRFAEEINTLEVYLKPTTSDLISDSRIRELLKKELVGRKWLFDAVEKWRTGTNRASRIFWFMGAPGIGKSAFVAHLAHFYGRATVLAVHFCDWQKPNHRDTGRIVRTVAFQIATRLPDYRKLLMALRELKELDLKPPAELFDYLLTDPLGQAIDGGRERHLIVIDALDEASEAGRNPLVELLARNAQRLPSWIGLVVTSRPEFDVKTPLQEFQPFPFEMKSDDNMDDIREYLQHELASTLQNRKDADRLVEQILDKSEGVFLYVELFCERVRGELLSLDKPEEFPKGLGGIFWQYFRRQFPDLEKYYTDVRPVLRAILAAREPLPLEILQNLMGWQDEELRDFTRPLASLFPISIESNLEVIKPYHKSLADWLAVEAKAGAYFVSEMEGHRTLVKQGWDQFEREPKAMDDYFLAWLPSHLRVLGDKSRLICLFQDFNYLVSHLRAVFHNEQNGLEPEEIKVAVATLMKAANADLQDGPQREIETEYAVFLYKCHEALRSAGCPDDAKIALRDSLRRRERLAESAATVTDKRSQLGAMIWCNIGLSTFASSTGLEKEKYIESAQLILQEIEQQCMEGLGAKDAFARLQGVVLRTLSSERPHDWLILLKQSVAAFRRARETSPDDRALEYSLGSTIRDLASAMLETGDPKAAKIYLREAKMIVEDLFEFQSGNPHYSRLDAHLCCIRSRLALLTGDQKTALECMREACSRIETAGVRLKNTLVQREIAQFKMKYEELSLSLRS